jgi:multidrug transporter EmrE-like cation transporter
LDCCGAWPFSDSRVQIMTAVTLMLGFASVSLNATAQIALRKTMLALGSLPLAASDLIAFIAAVLHNLWFLLGMGCYAVSIGLWLVVLSKLEVSAAYPLLSIGYVITAVIGFFFMDESVGILRVSGLGLICTGLVLISRSA